MAQSDRMASVVIPKSLAVMTILVSLFAATFACPNELRTFCGCVDESDGVLLNCSTGADVVELLNTMRMVQSHIGLLKSFSIHNSKISVLSNNLFSGLYIKRLEIVNCKVRSIEDDAFAGLESTLTTIRLANNLLEKIPVKALSGFHSLTHINLSNNSISGIDKEDALPSLPKLMDIDLSRNNISTLHKTFFEKAKNNLQTINLGHNTLDDVPASALRGFRQLMALHLHNNRIRNLAPMTFMNLPMLSLLNLASNKISEIHKQAFLNTPNLRFLYMTDNQLTKIQPYQFALFEELEMIDLSSNKLKKLDNDSFSNLKSLKQLYLGENLISHIDEYAFENSSVVMLILESNQLRQVSKNMFKGAKDLQQLSLKENAISNVDPNAFYNNRALIMVDLSHNEIMDLAPATFLSQLSMLLVDLSHNKLIRTPYSAFNRRITTVLLQENPLVCTEKMHMIQQGSGVFIPSSEDLICGNKPINETQLPTVTTTTASNVREHEKSEDSAFKQLPVSETAPTDVIEHTHLNSLPNIKKLATKKIATAQINQFIDQSQFQQQPQPATENTRPITRNDQINAETTVKRRPLFSTFSHFLQHTTPASASDSSSLVSQMQQNDEPNTTDSKEPPAKTAENHDIANDPNVIYPLPVPFLTGPPKMHTTRVINRQPEKNNANMNNIVITQTLPPSILIGPERPLQHGHSPEDGENSYHYPNYTKIEQVELNNNVENDFTTSVENAASQRKFSPFDQSFAENDHQEIRRSGSHNLSTVVITVCLSVVALVMCAVFVGMCVAKRRQMHLLDSSGDSSVGMSASPNGYPSHNYHHSHLTAVRAAQMNAMCGSTGTLSRSGTLSRLPPLQDDIYGWMYPPTAYNTYINK